MDPFLEDPAFWPDFHSRFINYWCEAIAEQLPFRYDARIGERVNLVERQPGMIRRVEPDVAVSHWGAGSVASSAAGDAVATLEPVTIPLVIEEPARQNYIEILRRPERDLVAVLELLSPSKKTPPGLGEYVAKRNAVLRQDVHLMELDYVYAWTIRQALPQIPVPLRSPDADVLIDLAAVMRTTYERGRYAKSINYEMPPKAALSSSHRQWIFQQTTAATTNGA
jgi:hypothetical protein